MPIPFELWVECESPAHARPSYWSTLSWDSWQGREWSELLSGGHHPELLGLCNEVLGAKPGSAPGRAGV